MSAGHGGRRVGAGRPKGRVSQETADIKTMIIGALQAVGGTDYLAARAIDTPTAFMALLGRVLPLQLAGHDGGRLEVEFRWRDDPQPVATINGIATDVDTTTNVDTDAGSDAAPTITFIGEC